MQRLLNPTELAERLSVSRAWVYDAAKVGRIPAIRIGGEDGPLRFVPEDVDRWLEEARTAGTPGARPLAPPDRAALPARPAPGSREGRRSRAPAASQQRLI